MAATIQLGDLEVDLNLHRVRKGETDIRLGRRERAILEMLVRNANQTLTHQQLLHEGWGPNYGDESKYLLHLTISRLRNKIGEGYIVGENNIGYRFDTKAQATFNASKPDTSPAAPAAESALYVPSPSFTNLPAQRTSFVGRDDEKDAIRELLMRPEIRMVTLTGPGGTGKTRLALEVASSLVDTFTNGVVFVPLAAVTEPPMVIRAMARALSVKEHAGEPAIETITSALRDKHLLLVLDNFEQVLDAAPSLSGLLDTCPSLKILVTSRAVLQIYGEHEYGVPPLTLPSHHDSYTLAGLLTFSAIALFAERARAGNRLFGLTEENAQTVIAICTRLDGLPLAIELATAQIKYLSPLALWERLKKDSALSLLTGGPRDLGTRQQTLRATIAWSYDLLAPEEQQLFRRIAVFEDGYTIEAIEQVCDTGGDLMLDPFDGMIALMDKSLVHAHQDAEGNTRFVMLQTIREFAQEQLTVSGERDLLAQRHAIYYSKIAVQSSFKSGNEEAAWFSYLDLEHGNIRQALRWFIQSGNAESALKTCGGIWEFWYTRGYFREGSQWISEALSTSGLVSDNTMGYAKYIEGIFSVALGLYDSAISAFREAQDIYLGQNDKLGLARISHSIGRVHMYRKNFEEAMICFNDAKEQHCSINNIDGVASALQNMGIICFERDDYENAQKHLMEVLEISNKQGDTYGIVLALAALGSTAYRQGKYKDAGDYYKRSLKMNQKLYDRMGCLVCIESLGLVAYDTEQCETAALLFSAGMSLRQSLGQPAIADSDPYRRQQQKILVAEERFGKQWATWWAEGAALRIEDILLLVENL